MQRGIFFGCFLKKIDIFLKMVYNVAMEKFLTAIIGGGASGLFLATSLKNGKNTILFERGERLGKKLSATGNGQGNVSNLSCTQEGYFSRSTRGQSLAQSIVKTYDEKALTAHFERAGLLLLADEKGRIYPTGKQASALTDALRFSLEQSKVETRLQTKITDLEKSGEYFLLTDDNGKKYLAKNVVLCAGGKAAKNFGTDGSAYALAEKFGHTLTALYPSLVQLKTKTDDIKTLKGIKISSASVLAKWQGGEKRVVGDLLFTDYGVSGDSVFKLSAYFADKIEQGVELCVDILPQTQEETIYNILLKKRENFPNMAQGELLGGIVNNQVGRAIMRRVNGDLKGAANQVKNFTLKVIGSLGFDYAQVTKGGICMDEVDETLQSKKVKGLYFAGEILDIDGPCGGFNLQWAYSSAQTVCKAIEEKNEKGRGQV